ncbi:MAG: sulfurtransferase TusA family protein [bacterium]|jgi:tRNA 2-thiouridine synthesizing protein A
MSLDVKKVVDTGCLTCAALYPKIKHELNTLDSGEIFELISNSPASLKDIPAWCRMTGNELVKTTEEGEKVTFTIKKA